jgi:threonine dehydrogenase-like Zn-dependent dehydrogenase
VKALCWYGQHDVRVKEVDEPQLLNPRDAIVRVTATTICGSDLHLYDGHMPSMEPGDILGHEFVGEVAALGSAVTTLEVGDRVVVPFAIACGGCFYCKASLTSLCDNSNPNAAAADALYGFSGSGLFGYSHLFGGYAGGQAEYVRVPFADFGPVKIPAKLTDEQALFLSDIFPTGYMAAENCAIQPGATVAVWGCGPVGQFAIRSALHLGAERVIAIDRVGARLAMAAGIGAEVIDFASEDVKARLVEMTAGRGPDACIDAVGLEAYGKSFDALYDRLKTTVMLAMDRPTVLRQAIQACRKGGTVSIPGVYGGLLDRIPVGSAFAKGLTLRMGQTHVHRYMRPLMALVETGVIDPTFVITHILCLDDAPDVYELFKRKEDGCVKVVLKP